MSSPTFTTLTNRHYATVTRWLRSKMAALKGAAVKLILEIADRTFGFRKWEDVIALSQFEQACGLCRETVVSTIDDLITLGLIRRSKAGNSYCYALCLPADLFVDKSVNAVENLSAL